MQNENELLAKILEIYQTHYFPTLGLKIEDIKRESDRIYLIHSESDVIISLLPSIDINTEK